MSDPVSPERRLLLKGLGASAFVTGCGLFQPAPIVSPPPWLDSSADRPPVVFVHGAFGARLRDCRTGRELWPGGLLSLVFGGYAHLALPLDPDSGDALADDVEPWALFKETGAVQFYGSLVDMLERAGGYLRAEPGRPVADGGPRQYAFLYDWRRDFAAAARGLDAFIDRVREDYADPALKVDLVAHSSGALVARHFLLHGGEPAAAGEGRTASLAGAAKVRRMVAVGAPELGMARAAAALVDGEPIVSNRMLPEVLATTVSPFELLPQGDDAWLVDASGVPVEADPCDLAVWREFGMSVFDPAVRARVRGQAGGGRAGRERLAVLERGFALRLERARLVHRDLRYAPVPASVTYYSIAGGCQPTLARLLVESFQGRPQVRVHPDAVRRPAPQVDCTAAMLDAGDGRVTRASATAEPAWPTREAGVPLVAADWRSRRVICASHNQLVVAPECQRALLQALAGQAPAEA